MALSSSFHSAESVTEGHPDKVCDQIADAILDEYLAQDPYSRVGCEVMAAKDLIVVAGEITSTAAVPIEDIARGVLRQIGYTDKSIGLDGNTCKVLISISKQSGSIRSSIDASVEVKARRAEHPFDALGAGDQSIVIGYACTETPTLMPLPIVLANQLAQQLSAVRKSGLLPMLRPDGKTLVTVEYQDCHPMRVSRIIISVQHDLGVNQDELQADIYGAVIEPCIPRYLLDEKTTYSVNTSGPWVYGGPGADTGLTGRKLAVDTYGPTARWGGGALSGKDPTKIDRSGAFAARHVAKNLVVAGVADRVEVEIGYAIGLARPVYVTVNTFGSEHIPVSDIRPLIPKHFELRPAGIIETLNLRRPIYRQLATYGQFGRCDIRLAWENTEIATKMKSIQCKNEV